MSFESIIEIIRKIWHDPVWSKVIAGIIILIIVFIVKQTRFALIRFFKFVFKLFSKKKSLSGNKITKIILNKTTEYNHFGFVIKQNEKYIKETKADFILWAEDQKKHLDIILCIFHMKDGLDMTEIRNFYDVKRKKLLSKYRNFYSRKYVRVVFIVVYESRKIKNNELARFIKENKEFKKSLPIGDFSYYIISKEELENFKIVDNEIS